ncbi:BQ5605_C024g09912 [Microbotryum silenes-dioicae]|uniref:BQ5605_C024g09912 protein n=1 Tax=Microbotryum silenes-dioicae TaxID=796604 RepID=A0A2X0MQ56_9BASI|nr:BQ5605_C024g09912 [Microbotryum silenes-dioicae]
MSALMRAYTRSFERRPYVTLLIANGLLMSLGDGAAQSLAMLTASSPDASAEVLAFDFARTFRFAFFGASMGPLAGAWNKFLEVRFPLRNSSITQQYPLQKVKTDDPASTSIPIPGFKMPKGAKLERGAGAGAAGAAGLRGSGNAASMVPTPPGASASAGAEGPVSNIQLVKRVAADQLGLAPISLFIFLMSMGLMEGLSDEELWDKIRNNYLPILLVNWQVWPLLQLINFRFVPLRYRVPYGSILGIGWSAFLSFKTAKKVEA